MERHPKTSSEDFDTKTVPVPQQRSRSKTSSSSGRSNSGRNTSGRSISDRNTSGRSASGRNASGRNASGRSTSGRNSSVQRRSSSSAGTRRVSSGQRRPANSPQERERRRRQAQLQKKRRILFGAAALLVVVVVVAIIILISSLIIPEASDLSLESSASTQILTWKGKPNKISYQIYRKSGDTDFELIYTVPEGGESSYVSKDLSSATLYEYKIVAVKGSGENARESKGTTVSAYTLPMTITGCTARTMSKESLTISWPEGESNLDGYELKYGPSENLESVEALTFTPSDVEKTSSNTLTYTVNNLEVGKTLYFSIRSVCAEEVYGEWSDVFSGTVTQAIDMTGIDIEKPMVALTYDDGPDSGKFTGRILSAVEGAGGHATFFQLGQLAEAYPDVIKQIVNGGHQIGCHTYDHEHMGDTVTEEDIVRANDVIEQVGGVRPDVFRAPGGEMADQIRTTCTEQGQSIYNWSVDTRDWASRDADSVVTEVQNQVEDGAIILMHNIYESTAEATERIAPWLAEQGYQLVTVSQLIQAKTGNPPVPGVEYFTATMTNEK